MNYSHEAKCQLFDLLAKEPLLQYVKVQRNTLGGEERATFIVTVSLEESKDWPNHILENSRFAKFYLGENKIEPLSGNRKFRKQAATSVTDAHEKILRFARAWSETPSLPSAA